jgi:hypothetical protein
MSVLPEKLMNSVLGKLYHELTMGDDAPLKDAKDFFTWITPGIPYTEDNLDFLERGFTPIHKGEDDDGEPIDEEELKRQLGAQKLRMYTQAEDLAYLMDFIPDASGLDRNGKQMNISTQIWNPHARVSDVYKYVLDQSQVVQTEVSESLKKKIERVRKILLSTKEVTDFDPDTFEEIKRVVTVDSIVATKYKEKKQLYDTAFMEYTNAEIAARAGDDPEAIDFFARNERILRSRVRLAENDWYAAGYKELYERATAFLAQAASTDLNMLMQDYREDMEFAQIANPASPGSKFYFTKLAPSGFASSSQGWTTFKFNKSHFESHYDATRKSWGAGGGLSIGSFTIGGSGGSTQSELNSSINWDKLEIEFSMAQVPIMRSWFHPNIFYSRFWRFGTDAASTGQATPLSDGKRPPEGQMVAYPTTAIFIRDLKFKFDMGESEYERFEKASKARGGLSWGPFSLGGRYSRNEKEVDYSSTVTRQGIFVEGMQLAGFRCHLLPKSPYPLTDVEEDRWV